MEELRKEEGQLVQLRDQIDVLTAEKQMREKAMKQMTQQIDVLKVDKSNLTTESEKYKAECNRLRNQVDRLRSIEVRYEEIKAESSVL